MGHGDTDTARRVLHDYRATLAELLLERFTNGLTQWAHARGAMIRNQAHGSPGNLLDLYAAVDIPETEHFGPEGAHILFWKFASSAAHAAGHNLVSSESCTWLTEHFQGTLGEVKTSLDRLFLAGINHVFFHGTAYSPEDAAWPGWLFYASTDFVPANPIWRDLPALAGYIARCQSFLQAGRPDNDLLLYFPMNDYWMTGIGEKDFMQPLTAHNTEHWLDNRPVGEAAQLLWERGYAFDYVSDRLLEAASVENGQIRLGEQRYRVMVVPKCRFIPFETMQQLHVLANAGAHILFVDSVPTEIPGLAQFETRQADLDVLLNSIGLSVPDRPAQSSRPVGAGTWQVAIDLDPALAKLGVSREPLVDSGLEFVRRRHNSGWDYFVLNAAATPFDGEIALGRAVSEALIFDPYTQRTGVAATRTDAGVLYVRLQLQPDETCVVRAIAGPIAGQTEWRYLDATAKAIELPGPWHVEFIEGGPELPADRDVPTLSSWTEWNDPALKRFAGTARYSTSLNLDGELAGSWLLDLGNVAESAQVFLDDVPQGTLIQPPYRMPIENPGGDGPHILAVLVTNLAANRIADMDRNAVPWRVFKDINFVNTAYKPFDASSWPVRPSGLIGPVQIFPQSHRQ